MMRVSILVAISLCALAVLGDYFLKRASSQPSAFWNKWFWLGFAFYASTAFGWVLVMRHLKLGTIGIIYSISTALMLVVLGVCMFGESLTRKEFLGLVLAIASLVLVSSGEE